MLKRYKNEFFKAIQGAGLEVSDFSGKEEIAAELPAFTIRYTPGKIFFLARQAAVLHSQRPAEAVKDGTDQFDYQYSRFTGADPPPVKGPTHSWCDFAEVIKKFRQWLDSEVRAARQWVDSEVMVAMEEQLIPDLWSQATSISIEAHPINSQGASNFTEEERQQIKLAVSNFRLLVVETFAPTEDQLTVVAEQLAYLTSAIDRLNRFDWKAVAISTLLAITVALSLDTERGRQLYGLFQQAFSGLSHLLK
ncbi:MAG: hypothetical protein A3F68_11765 [Acidobacteria bacterium RIFCSPLOWO2_12_FULL_54_10]|nr:MAG: hypothetical protein A3F68_11765 [Acidobacteria bacterium RIFCSPLOWO2_12_FULL_54_10]